MSDGVSDVNLVAQVGGLALVVRHDVSFDGDGADDDVEKALGSGTCALGAAGVVEEGGLNGVKDLGGAGSIAKDMAIDIDQPTGRLYSAVSVRWRTG